MRITTVSTNNVEAFDAKVNRMLKEGWELHGTPTTQTVAEQDCWDGEPYSRSVTTYTQVLKIDN